MKNTEELESCLSVLEVEVLSRTSRLMRPLTQETAGGRW